MSIALRYSLWQPRNTTPTDTRRRIESIYKSRRIGRGRVVDRFQIRRVIVLVYGPGAPGAAPNRPKTRLYIQGPQSRGALGRAPQTYTAVRNASLC